MTIKTNPFKAVSFVESSVRKALEAAGYLIADIKYDGVRGNICVDNTAQAQWLSRVSKEIPALAHLNGFEYRWQRLLADDRCIYPEGFMLDGELIVKGVDFNTGSGILRSKWVSAKNRAFHLHPEETGKKLPFFLDATKLEVRLYAVAPYYLVENPNEELDVMTCLMQEHVKAMLPLLREYFPEIDWQAAESYEVYDMTELTALYEMKRGEGHEGLIVKDPFCFYKRGKKTGWWKMKPEEEADGIVQGIVWGTPGLANEGKVIGFEVLLESGRLVNACNISRALMDEFTAAVKAANPCTTGPCQYAKDVAMPEAHCGNRCMYEDHPMVNPYHGWACQISYMEETPDGSLRHPTFVMFRGTEDNPEEKI